MSTVCFDKEKVGKKGIKSSLDFGWRWNKLSLDFGGCTRGKRWVMS
jgi:hypothetical protein